jgi:hypothetical protein
MDVGETDGDRVSVYAPKSDRIFWELPQDGETAVSFPLFSFTFRFSPAEAMAIQGSFTTLLPQGIQSIGRETRRIESAIFSISIKLERTLE